MLACWQTFFVVVHDLCVTPLDVWICLVMLLQKKQIIHFSFCFLVFDITSLFVTHTSGAHNTYTQRIKRNMFSLTSSLTAATALSSTSSSSSSSLKRSNGRGKMTIVNVGASEKDDVPVGAKVRVNKSVVVYHVPKTKGAATDLNGMEGEVAQRADDLDGTYISANLPVKVALPNPDGSGKTFLVHVTADEIEIL